MTLDQFTELLDRHGADPAHWPRDTQAAAHALLEHSSEAAGLLAEQRRLDAALGRVQPLPPAPSARLRHAILAAAPRPKPERRSVLAELWQFLGGTRIAGPAFATALLLGLTLGGITNGNLPASEPDNEDLVALAQLDDDYLAY